MTGGRLDPRLRRVFATVDTAADFEARVLARVAAAGAAPDPQRRLLADRQRESTLRRLRREAWMNAANAAGIAAAFLAFAWREGPALADWLGRGLAASSGPGAIIGLSCALAGLGAWIALQRQLPQA